jgi:hypothetical protein
MDKSCEDTGGQMCARILMDRCCEDRNGQMFRGYGLTDVARIQMDKCCEDDVTYICCGDILQR